MIPRMNFDDLYPRAEVDYEAVASCILRVPTEASCFVCGRLTRWVSVSFEAHVCSAICDDLSWLRYWRADAAAARADRGDTE